MVLKFSIMYFLFNPKAVRIYEDPYTLIWWLYKNFVNILIINYNFFWIYILPINLNIFENFLETESRLQKEAENKTFSRITDLVCLLADHLIEDSLRNVKTTLGWRKLGGSF